MVPEALLVLYCNSVSLSLSAKDKVGRAEDEV